MYTNLIGTCASILSSLSFFPQVYKVYKERSAQGISSLSFSIITMASSLWMTYGILLVDWPLIATNAIVGSLSLSMIVAKFIFRQPLKDAISSSLSKKNPLL